MESHGTVYGTVVLQYYSTSSVVARTPWTLGTRYVEIHLCNPIPVIYCCPSLVDSHKIINTAIRLTEAQ